MNSYIEKLQQIVNDEALSSLSHAYLEYLLSTSGEALLTFSKVNVIMIADDYW